MNEAYRMGGGGHMHVEVGKPQSMEQRFEKDLSIGPNSLET